MNKIKVAMVAPYPAQLVLPINKIKATYRGRPSHAAPWVRSLTTAMRKRDDVEFRVFTHSREVSRMCEGEENGVPFTVIPQYEPGRIGARHLHLPARIQFKKHIQKYAPDLVHGFGTESAYGLIASEQGVPSLVFIQGILSEYVKYNDSSSVWLKKIRLNLERRVVMNIDGLIAETAFAERWAIGMKKTAKVAVIPHAVNSEFFNVSPVYSENECLCVGAISRRKGVDTAIRALSITKDSTVRLSVIGVGSLLADMRKLAADLGVSHRIDFCGHLNRKQIIEKMATARMLVILSRMDTSPNILTEAHAAGLPVIGTRAGGIPDMIEEGKDGFLIDVDDYRAVAEKMDNLFSDMDLCRRLGESGREKVKWLNDPDRIADLHVRFYRQVLAGGAVDV